MQPTPVAPPRRNPPLAHWFGRLGLLALFMASANVAAIDVSEDNTLSIANPGLLYTCTQPAHGTLSGTTTYIYTPATNYNGADSFVLCDDPLIFDPMWSMWFTYVVTVTAVNDAPSFTKGANVTVNENSGAYSGAWATAISPGPADEAAQTLTFSTANDNNALFSSQPAVAANGTLSFTPAPNGYGSATVTVVLQDSGGTANGGVDSSAPQTFVITVNHVNTPPVAAADAFTGNEDNVIANNVLTNDSDPNGDPLSAVPVAAPSHGSLTLNANGSFTYTPTANYNGADSFSYQANDGTLNSDITFVNLTINAVNDAPSFTKGADVTVNANSGPYSGAWATAISPGPADEAAQTLTFHVVLNTTTALFTAAGQPALTANGVLSFTPAPNASGTANVTVTLYDRGGIANGGVNSSASQTFTITVVPLHTVTPSAGANGTLSPTAAQTINHGSTATFTVTPNTDYTAAMGGSCGGTLVGSTYTTAAITADCSVTAQFIRNFTASDDSGAALGDRTVPSGDAVSFRLTDGSGSFAVVDASNASGVRGTLVDNGDGSYRFEAPTSGAFAGDYRITISDAVSGYNRQFIITVPLQVMLSRATLLAAGERNHASVTVTGAMPATAITLRVESSALSGVPTTDDSHMVAADDAPHANPASGQVTAQPTAHSIPFTLVASAAGYADGRAAAQVVPAVSYAGSLQNPIGGVVVGKAELRTNVAGITTTLLDELNAPYETNSDAQGQFSLIGPADGLDYLLRLSAAGYAAKSVAASDCLAISPCLVVLDYEFTSATPELNPPGGTYSGPVAVTLTTTTADATLVYTLDGTTPSRSNGISVASGTVVQLNNSKTLQVMAWKEGLNDSPVVSAHYTIQNSNQVGIAELLDMVNVDSTQQSSGGGAMGWGMLLALGAMVFGRRRLFPTRLAKTL